MVVSSLILIFSLAQAPYPEDPFAEEYRLQSSSELGVAAGQIRPIAFAGVLGREIDVLIRGTTEWTTTAHFALRGSIELQPTQRTALARLHSARAGIGVNLLPHRRFNVGLWFEAGPAYSTEPGTPARLLPLVVGGAALDFALSSIFFLRLEAQLGWTTLPATWLRPAVLAGLGVTL